jgi:hypothetical protein
MATFSGDQFMELLKAQDEKFMHMMKILKEDKTAQVTKPPGLVETKKDQFIINAKHMRADIFDGNKVAFDEWSFSFKRGIRSMSKRAYDMLVKYEVKENDNAESEEIMNDEDEKQSAELYDVLCQYCSGEALMIVRSVTDCEGYRAWQRLHRKFNPRTMARGLRLLSEAINPAVAKDLAGVEQAIVQWEEKLKKLGSQFGETLTPFMKIAILTSIIPTSLQEYVYTHIDEKLEYENLKEKIKAMTGHKLDSMKPIPADLGNVEDEYWWDAADAEEVDAVGADTQCFRCQGWGHLSKDCPSKGKSKGKGVPPKGKGKGQYQFQKGGKKGGGKGFQGAKGTGKSYFPGACYVCGQTGHKAADCPSQAQTNAIETDEATDVGGIWVIGAVQAEFLSIQGKGQKDPSITGGKGQKDPSITGLDIKHTLRHLHVPNPSQFAGVGAPGSKDPSTQAKNVQYKKTKKEEQHFEDTSITSSSICETNPLAGSVPKGGGVGQRSSSAPRSSSDWLPHPGIHKRSLKYEKKQQQGQSKNI